MRLSPNTQYIATCSSGGEIKLWTHSWTLVSETLAPINSLFHVRMIHLYAIITGVYLIFYLIEYIYMYMYIYSISICICTLLVYVHVYSIISTLVQ